MGVGTISGFKQIGKYGRLCPYNVVFVGSVVRQVDGQTVIRYKHPGPVYGCDWNPNTK